MTAPRRRSVFADWLLEFPDFVFSDGGQFKHRGGWRNLFRDRIGDTFDDRLIFEIGCNDATLLATVAAKHPTTAFVGIDWKYRALHTAAERVAAAGLRNVALLHGRGQDVRRIFGDGEVDEVWVFHPDPCDKPNELPNRLIGEPFLIDLGAVLRDERSLLILKTDHRDYFEEAKTQAARPAVSAMFAVAASSTDFWNDAAVRAHVSTKAFAGEATLYEERFRRKRKPIYYLEMRRRRTRPEGRPHP